MAQIAVNLKTGMPALSQQMFAVNYNILRIQSGLGGVAFVDEPDIFGDGGGQGGGGFGLFGGGGRGEGLRAGGFLARSFELGGEFGGGEGLCGGRGLLSLERFHAFLQDDELAGGRFARGFDLMGSFLGAGPGGFAGGEFLAGLG